MFVSFATPINPITRDNWEGRGVIPDVMVAQDEALETARRLALEAALAKGLSAPSAIDTRWALEALLAEAGSAPTLSADDHAGVYGPVAITGAQDRLLLGQGRRPARTLLSVGADTFAVRENPSQRVVFQRDAEGKIVALELRYSDGDVVRHRRGE